MALERIQPQGLAKPATYTHVIKAGNTAYIAGQTATDAQGNIVGRGDIVAQSVQVFENLKAALASVGGTFEHLVSINVYLTDPRYRDQMRDVRTRYLGNNLPTSTLLIVAGLADPEYLLEISAVAVVG
jgi:2-iminobutanoate/2-iminopropanoate deaminase